MCIWHRRALPAENAPYLVVPTSVDAGVGEQGRCSFVITKEFGNNFNPSAVATDMPLALDRPASEPDRIAIKGTRDNEDILGKEST